MTIKVLKILQLTSGKLIKGNEDYTFNSVLYDVIKGYRPSSHFLYIPYINSYRKIDSTSEIEKMPQYGAKGVIIHENMGRNIDLSGYDVVIVVKDIELAVLKLAGYFRVKNNNTIIAVTGSSGKTTSKELISEILRENDVPHLKTLRNINGYGGASLTLFSLNSDDTGVLEVGVNGLKRLPTLTRTISPNYLLVTNIYPTHFDKLPNLEDVAKYKLSLAEHMESPKKKVLFGECTYLKKYIDQNTVTFGWNKDNNYSIGKIIYTNKTGSKFTINAKDKEFIITTPLLGKHNIINCLGVFALAAESGMDPQKVIRAIGRFSGLKDDFYATSGIYKAKGWNFFDDSQHFNLPALRTGLDTFLNITEGQGGTILLSYDYKFDSEHFSFEELMSILLDNKQTIKHLILLGEGWKKWLHRLKSELCKNPVLLLGNVDAAKYIREHINKSEFIYLKGDFHHRLRGIISMLEEDNFELR